MNNFLLSLSLSRCELHEGDADICLVYHKQASQGDEGDYSFRRRTESHQLPTFQLHMCA